MLNVDLEIRWGGAVIQTVRSGGVGGLPKTFLQPFWPQFGLKRRGAGQSCGSTTGSYIRRVGGGVRGVRTNPLGKSMMKD